jgi:hypothetical protein
MGIDFDYILESGSTVDNKEAAITQALYTRSIDRPWLEILKGWHISHGRFALALVLTGAALMI